MGLVALIATLLAGAAVLYWVAGIREIHRYANTAPPRYRWAARGWMLASTCTLVAAGANLLVPPALLSAASAASLLGVLSLGMHWACARLLCRPLTAQQLRSPPQQMRRPRRPMAAHQRRLAKRAADDVPILKAMRRPKVGAAHAGPGAFQGPRR